MKLFFSLIEERKFKEPTPRFVENSFNQSKSFRLPHRNISEKTGKVFCFVLPKKYKEEEGGQRSI